MRAALLQTFSGRSLVGSTRARRSRCNGDRGAAMIRHLPSLEKVSISPGALTTNRPGVSPSHLPRRHDLVVGEECPRPGPAYARINRQPSPGCTTESLPAEIKSERSTSDGTEDGTRPRDSSGDVVEHLNSAGLVPEASRCVIRDVSRAALIYVLRRFLEAT